MTSKKKRIDSAIGQQEIIQKSLSSEVQIPHYVELRDCDMPFWYAITRARAKSEWKEHELILAAQLARCQADIEIEQEKLYLEGTTTENARGTPVTNPRFGAIAQLKAIQLSTLKALSLHTGAGVPKRELTKRTNIAQETEAKVDEALMNDDDSLIARPMLQ